MPSYTHCYNLLIHLFYHLATHLLQFYSAFDACIFCGILYLFSIHIFYMFYTKNYILLFSIKTYFIFVLYILCKDATISCEYYLYALTGSYINYDITCPKSSVLIGCLLQMSTTKYCVLYTSIYDITTADCTVYTVLCTSNDQQYTLYSIVYTIQYSIQYSIHYTV